ncbi:MAG TPA: excinuclease ABC subunit UvrA [Candidatus Thermoplasmatota archaeon]|nr:excinuclease ABC subunit UvrA [Candidatus Thermoplasmatota archaeon]
MARDSIIVKGAREHNLKNIDVELPRNRLNVITGLSGSGKSSLAFDTLYAEGQRRYVESLSAYARQFLGQMEKPEVDAIEGLSPAISIDQKTTSKNPRSTVGTITEIYDYLRVLFANLGIPHCPQCGKPIMSQSAQQIVDRLLALPEGSKLQILAPVVRDRKGEYKKLFQDLKAQGYLRVRVNGQTGGVDDDWKLARYEKHTIEVIVDRVVTKKGDEGLNTRLTDAVEQALKLGEGVVGVLVGDQYQQFSEKNACSDCGVSLGEIAPRNFSFNSPHGACTDCAGLGFNLEVDPAVVIVDATLSLNDGALHPEVMRSSPWILKEIQQVGKHYGFSLGTPWKQLSAAHRNIILHGSDKTLKMRYESKSGFVWESHEQYEGIVPRLERYYKETESEAKRERIQELMSSRPCKGCNGTRLKKEILGITIKDNSIAKLCAMPVERLFAWFQGLEQGMSERERKITAELIKEIRERLRFMLDVGLEYLTLDRSSATLSGGEAQRIRLATQIGSGLVGVLYILDEPSIGLHQRDNHRLIQSLKGLRDLGNTLVVVEHDEDMIRAADYVLDLGPGAGEHGGRIVAEGTPEEIIKNPNSITGHYLSGKEEIEVPLIRRPGNGKWISVRGARENNLKNVDVDIPLGLFACVTGVSGSGKSTLVNDVLYKAMARALNGASTAPGVHDSLEGLEHLDKVIIIDQSPIGRTPRSNPATYTGLFTPIRELFASTQDAKQRGFEKGRFSFNVKGGRCEGCEGDGVTTIEMHFLADVYVPCEVCKGARYNKETLQVRYKGKNIHEVLNMTVEEACTFFENVPVIHRPLQTLMDVGLSYMRLGQSSTTLSGGEAQRVKLATELQKRATGKTLYILDEPTTGLHFADVKRLLGVLQRLVDGGNTMVIIEHNLDVIKTADWIIDLGPEGGEKGGTIVAQGTPEDVARVPESYTGQFLKPLLKGRLGVPGVTRPKHLVTAAPAANGHGNGAKNGNGNGHHVEAPEAAPAKRGRPKGSKNKPKPKARAAR